MWCSQSDEMECTDPTNAVTMKSTEKVTNPKESKLLLAGVHNGTPFTFRWKTAGRSKVKGTLVSAPMNATRSLKNGMEFATTNALAAVMAVKNILSNARNEFDQL